MIEKVDNLDIVPKDIKELLVTDEGEFIPIGNNIYRLKQFSIKKHFELLYFISEYYSIYNDIFNKNTDKNLEINQFFGILSKELIKSELLDKFFKTILPELHDTVDNITQQQLEYLIGVIYKQNFLSKSLPIKNQETRLSIHKMKEMLGLNLKQKSK